MRRYAVLLAIAAVLPPTQPPAQTAGDDDAPVVLDALDPAAIVDDLGGRPAAGLDREALYRLGRGVVAGAFDGGPSGACMSCHGMDGRGDAVAGFPRLAGQAEDYLAATLADYAAGRRQNPVMTPIAEAMTADQIVAVAAYYSTSDAPPMAVAEVSVPAELLQYGGALAAIGNAHRSVQGCINCHGPDGRGLPPTYPYLAGQTAEYLAAQLRAWKSGERGGDLAGIMTEISERLTDEDIRAVSAYYASIRQEAPISVGAVAAGAP